MRETVLNRSRVIQFGGGNFLRAFSDWMFQKNNDSCEEQIVVTLVKPTEGGDYSDLRAQKGLFHVVVEGLIDGKPRSLVDKVDVIDEIIHPYRNFGDFLKSAEDKTVKMIVSNTTESGIKYIDEPYKSDAPVHEFPGKLCQWLYHRYQKLGDNAGELIVLPTELIEQNGDSLKSCIIKYSGFWGFEEDFNKWLDRTCIFVNTLVDRIVPGYSEEAFHKVKAETGISDNAVVVAEPYHSLVISSEKNIEDLLPLGAADLNVKLVNDLSVFRQKKVRILNGAHTAMVPVGILNDISTVIEVVKTPWVSDFVKELLLKEVVPTLDGDKVDARRYVETTLERFGNPYLQHKLSDIALNSISKCRFRLLPSLLVYYENTGKLPSRITFSMAHWFCIYLFDGFGKFQAKDTTEVLAFFETQKRTLKANTGELENVLERVLGNSDFWGMNLNEIDGLKKQLADHIENIRSEKYNVLEYVKKLR